MLVPRGDRPRVQHHIVSILESKQFLVYANYTANYKVWNTNRSVTCCKS